MIPFDFSNQERGSFVKLSTRRIVIEFESDPSFFFLNVIFEYFSYLKKISRFVLGFMSFMVYML